MHTIEAGGMSLNTTAVRIKLPLKNVKLEMMRWLVVPVTLRLDRLHLTLQTAFGWTNSHFCEFLAGEGRSGIHDPVVIASPAHRCPQGAALRYCSRDWREYDALSL
ncbi:IS1096 element passenger TnpR family protein [Bradyrhizobium pachyrhizi]|uniref:IS1096 element passenger TnpR family protein n=1 Tax=Bradyrhizobium pachyrhizi TaxID=280333 RepID=UPI003D15FD3B